MLTQWDSCKPIIVIQFSPALCGPGLVIVSLGGLFLTMVWGHKLGIQCSIALIKPSIVKQKNIVQKLYIHIYIYIYIYKHTNKKGN